VSFALDDTHILADVCGAMDRNLDYIERRMDVSIRCRGNDIQINGDLAEDAQEVMRQLYRHLQCSDEPITNGLIDTKIRDAAQLDLPAIPAPSNVVPQVSIRTRRKTITPRTQTQTQYISAMQRGEDLVFGLGPAGTGKTYLAVAQAVSQLIQGKVQRLIFSRPAVEAGEKLGFLPGDMKDKVDPYLRPIYDALYDCLPPEQVETRLASGEIEVAPLAIMRGRTLADAFIILDEAQNTTKEQMKMFLTRFGENSQMIICGDPRQTDIPGGTPMSGLTDAMSKLKDVDGISFIEFSAQDVVRHPIVGKIVHAYEGDSE
jgi:phosphate starvation-inducible PhoH-like protein